MNWSPDANPASGPVSGVTKPIVIVSPLLMTDGPALPAGSPEACARAGVAPCRRAGVDATPPRAPMRLPAAAARAVTPVTRSTVRRENLALHGVVAAGAASVPASGSDCASERTAESGSSPAISLLPGTLATPRGAGEPCAPPRVPARQAMRGPDGRGP